MLTRRTFITAAAVTGLGGAGALTYHSTSRGNREYEEAAARTWRHSDTIPEKGSALMRELIRYATLAPSSHNTQCWHFRPDAQSITILPDLTRRCPVVDPDDHHLYTSLGCAAENLLLAAKAMGYDGEPVFSAAEQQSLTIPLTQSATQRSPLFEAIPKRQSTRCEYDGKPLGNDELKQLERTASGEGVRVILLTKSAAIENVLDFVVQANNIQIRDPAYVQELKQWMRFNGRQAAQSADGLYVATSGNPTLPSWLGSRMFDLFFTPDAENDRYARQLRSSAGIAVFVSERELPAQWIEVGRAFQRFALQATAMGIRTAHLNQAVEPASIRRLFAESLGITNGRPDLVVRFGRGPVMPRSLRRPVEAVLV